MPSKSSKETMTAASPLIEKVDEVLTQVVEKEAEKFVPKEIVDQTLNEIHHCSPWYRFAVLVTVAVAIVVASQIVVTTQLA